VILQSDQYRMYLHMLANYIFSSGGNAKLGTKLYCLNKALHGVDIYCSSQLAEVFLFVRPCAAESWHVYPDSPSPAKTSRSLDAADPIHRHSDKKPP